MKLADIQITHVQNMVIELANKGYKKSTIRSTVSVVSSCLERAVIGKMLLFNPCRGIVYPEIEVYKRQKLKKEKEAQSR